MRHRFVVAASVVALALLAGACGGGGGVGGDLDKVKGGSGANALGQATTTSPPTTGAASATTAPKPVATTARPQPPSAVYTIQSDTKGQYIEPLTHSVVAGAIVRFNNTDSIGHQITGKLNGAQVFTTPLIAPGSFADVRATVRGTIDITDEQRTYAQGVTLTVS